MLEKKLSQAKTKLLVNYPLFGTIASKIELVLDDDLQSFKSDGTTLRCNSDFLASLSVEEMEFVFANSAMHASLSYDMRKNNRSGWLWQLSTDYAINDMLVENGLERPLDANYSKRFSGMYAEEIYAELKEDILRDELEYEADDIDDVQDNNQQNKQNDELGEQLFDEFVKSVVMDEAKNDELPLHLERFFKYVEPSKIDWRGELRDALERFHKDDYALMPPNKKYLHLGLYLPSSISNTFKFAVAIDSSGSIDEKLLNLFLSELNYLLNIIGSYQIELFVCDDVIRKHTTIYSGEDVSCEVFGGGATDFRAVFEYIESNLDDIKLLLYFTDLDGVFPKEMPKYSVKWISGSDLDAPFGEVIRL